MVAERVVTTKAAHRTFGDEHLVASITGMSVKTLRKWRLLGRGPSWKKFGGSVRYDLAELDNWIRRCPAGGASSLEPERSADSRRCRNH